MCYFFSFMDNILYYNNNTKSYFSNKGIEIPIANVANKLGKIVT